MLSNDRRGPDPRRRCDRGSPLSPRREAFCRHYLATGIGAEAARRAGYKAASAVNQAHRLLGDPAIRSRIDDLRLAAVDRECNGRDTFLIKLETLYRQALDGGRYTAAVRAVELQYKLAGVVPPQDFRVPPLLRPAAARRPMDIEEPVYLSDPALDPAERARLRRAWRRGADSVFDGGSRDGNQPTNDGKR